MIMIYAPSQARSRLGRTIYPISEVLHCNKTHKLARIENIFEIVNARKRTASARFRQRLTRYIRFVSFSNCRVLTKKIDK